MANKVSVELDAKVTGFEQGMNQATESAKKYETEQKKISESTINFRKELAKTKKQVFDLSASYEQLDAAAKQSSFGKEMKRQLDEAKAAAANFIDMQGDISAELKGMASDTATLDLLKDSVALLGNVASTAAGSIALLTGNEKDAQKAVVMFTTAQSALNTMISISNALEKQSSVMRAIGTVKTLAATAAENLRTAATGKGVIATKAATVAQKAFNAVANANPYVLLATAAIAAVTAIYAFCKATDDATDDQEELNKKAEEAQKKIEEQRNTFLGAAKTYQETAVKIDSLFLSYKRSNNEISKKKILTEAQAEFKKLGYECKNLDDAQKLLVEHGPTVAKIIREQGVIAGLTALKMEAYSKSVKMLMENGYSANVASILAESNKDFVDLGREIDRRTDALAKEQSKLKKYENKGSGSGSKSSKGEIKALEGSIDAIEAKIKKLQEYLRKGILPKGFINVDAVIKEIEKLTSQKKGLEIKLGFSKPDPKDIKGTEAWYKEEIKKLEEQKALLPLDAYIERDKLQNQIDGLTLKLELETKGITINAADVKKQVSEVQDIINKALKGDGEPKFDFSGLDEEAREKADKMLEEFNRIADGRKQLQKVLDDKGSSAQAVEAATEGINQLTEAYTPLLEKLNEYNEKSQSLTEANKTLEKQVKAIRKVADIAGQAGDAFRSIGEATGSVELQVMGIIAQALATVALSFAQALSSCKTWVEWLAFGVTGLATMVTMISQIKSVTSGGYAQGGIIGGSSYSGDKLLANVNSGEMILNQRQQRNLFNMLDTGAMPQRGGSIVQVEGVIHGTDILLVQKNTNKVRGRAGSAITF